MNTEEQIIIRLANWRSYILHMLEGHLPAGEFQAARTIILKSLGDNGLKGDVKKIFKQTEGTQNEKEPGKKAS